MRKRLLGLWRMFWDVCPQCGDAADRCDVCHGDPCMAYRSGGREMMWTVFKGKLKQTK